MHFRFCGLCRSCWGGGACDRTAWTYATPAHRESGPQEGGSGAARRLEHALDRLVGRLLKLQVDRARHLEPATEDPPCTVGGDQLVGDVVDEVLARIPPGAGKMNVLRARQCCSVVIFPWSYIVCRT